MSEAKSSVNDRGKAYAMTTPRGQEPVGLGAARSPLSIAAETRVAQLEARGLRRPALLGEKSASVLERWLVWLNRVALVLGIAGLVLSIIVVELRFASDGSYMDVMKVLVSVTTLMLAGVICCKYHVMLLFLKARGSLDLRENLYTSGKLTLLVVELVICLPHPLPFVDKSFDIDDPVVESGLYAPVYTLDALLSAWMLLRLYLAASVFHDAAGFHSHSARVVAHWNNVSFSPSFTFKAMMDRHPLRLLAVILVVTVAGLGYLMRVFEAPLCVDPIDVVEAEAAACAPFRAHTYFLNSMWFVVVTMSTVGYGDITVVTSGGRCVAVMACFMGVVVIALFVTGVTAMSAFTPDERRAFLALYRTTGKLEQQHMAARVIQGVWAYYKAWAAPLRHRRGNKLVPEEMGRLSALLEDVSAYKRLLSVLRRWRVLQGQQQDLHKEKSEVALIQKEVLNTSMQLGDFIDSQVGHNDVLARVLPAVVNQLDRISAHLGLPPTVEPARSPAGRESRAASLTRSHLANVPDARRRSLLPRQRSMDGRSLADTLRTSSRGTDVAFPGTRSPVRSPAGMRRGRSLADASTFDAASPVASAPVTLPGLTET